MSGATERTKELCTVNPLGTCSARFFSTDLSLSRWQMYSLFKVQEAANQARAHCFKIGNPWSQHTDKSGLLSTVRVCPPSLCDNRTQAKRLGNIDTL